MNNYIQWLYLDYFLTLKQDKMYQDDRIQPGKIAKKCMELYGFISGLNAQTKEVKYSYGAVLLPDTIYKKIQKVNWDTLRKYAPNNSPGVVHSLSGKSTTLDPLSQ